MFISLCNLLGLRLLGERENGSEPRGWRRKRNETERKIAFARGGDTAYLDLNVSRDRSLMADQLPF